MLYPPSVDLLRELRALRDRRWSVGHDDAIERDREAFLIHLDVGAAYYLASCGTVLVCERWRESTTAIDAPDDEALAALDGGGRFTPGLLALIPPR